MPAAACHAQIHLGAQAGSVCNRLLAGTSNGVYQLSLSGQVPTPTPTLPTVTPTPTKHRQAALDDDCRRELRGRVPEGGMADLRHYSGEGEYYWANAPAGRPAAIRAVGGWAVAPMATPWPAAPSIPTTPKVGWSMVPLAWSAPPMPRLSSSVGLQRTVLRRAVLGSIDQRHQFLWHGPAWRHRRLAATNFDLTNVYTLGNLLGQPQVWIAVRFFSDYSVTYPEGAYVDDIGVRKRTTLEAPVAGQDQNGPPCVTSSLPMTMQPETLALRELQPGQTRRSPAFTAPSMKEAPCRNNLAPNRPQSQPQSESSGEPVLSPPEGKAQSAVPRVEPRGEEDQRRAWPAGQVGAPVRQLSRPPARFCCTLPAGRCGTRPRPPGRCCRHLRAWRPG